MQYLTVLKYLAPVLIMIFAGYLYYSLSYELYVSEMSRNGKGYVSDEVWYVNSARNILRKAFNITDLRVGDKYGLTIVYDNRFLNRSFFEDLIEKHGLNISIVDSNYFKINAVYFESSNRSEIERFKKIIYNSNISGINDVIVGWRLGDHGFLNTYLNWEHPPLGKYFIGLSMITLGDNQVNWRIPSIIAGVLTVFFIYLVSYRLTNNVFIASITSLISAIDPLMRILSSVALLDIYVALFTAITLYFIISRRVWFAYATVLIGSLFKMNVIFLLIPVFIILIRRELVRKQSFTTLFTSLIKYTVLSITILLILHMIASIPLINYASSLNRDCVIEKPSFYCGLTYWLDKSVFGAIKWHTSIKCDRPGCPTSSSPWDWFIGNNGFTIYYFKDGGSLVALGFYPLWSITLLLSIYLLPLYRSDSGLRKLLLVFHGLFLGYVILYVIGNRTQYSFYSVQFTPLTYTLLVYSFIKAFVKPDVLKSIILDWYKVLYSIWLFILRYILLIKPG